MQITKKSIFNNSKLDKKSEILKLSPFSFDTENNSWKTIRSMNVARSYAAVTTFNGCIYMAGGSISCDSDNSVELYNPRTDEWVEQAPSQVPCKLLIESNGFLFSIGRGQKNIERFKPYKNSWEMVCKFSVTF